MTNIMCFLFSYYPDPESCSLSGDPHRSEQDAIEFRRALCYDIMI